MTRLSENPPPYSCQPMAHFSAHSDGGWVVSCGKTQFNGTLLVTDKHSFLLSMTSNCEAKRVISL